MLLSKLTSQRLIAHHRPAFFRTGHVAAVIPHKKKSNKAWLSASLPLSQIDPQSTESTLPSILALNESILTSMHHAGLPWWATIISSTLLLRSTFTLPIAIYQQRSLAKMIALAPMVQSWAETLKVQVGKDSRDRGWSYGTYQAELQKQYRKKVNAIYAQYGCSRYKLLLLPYVQIPLFVSMSLTLRHMTAYPLPWFGQTAQSPVQGLDQGGLAPFLDLTAVDPTLILPVLVGAGNLLNVEVRGGWERERGTDTDSSWMHGMLKEFKRHAKRSWQTYLGDCRLHLYPSQHMRLSPLVCIGWHRLGTVSFKMCLLEYLVWDQDWACHSCRHRNKNDSHFREPGSFRLCSEGCVFIPSHPTDSTLLICWYSSLSFHDEVNLLGYVINLVLWMILLHTYHGLPAEVY